MNQLRLNRCYTLQGFTRNLGFGKVHRKRPTRGTWTQSKRLRTSANASEIFTHQSRRVKRSRNLTARALETPYSQSSGSTQDIPTNDGSKNKHLFCGTNETQVSEGGEADLHQFFKDCKKNPGHKKFVPVNCFNMDHMPEGCHDEDLVEYIKATAGLTVRVDVKLTSTERPQFTPQTSVPYAFYNMRGSRTMRFGSGTVWYVNKSAEEYYKGACQCLKCQQSDTPNMGWGKVRMYTARHVVYDDHEARHTTCRLFYDGQDSPLVTLDGWSVVVANTEEDWCMLECATCDSNILDILDQVIKHWVELLGIVNNKYKLSRAEDKFMFMVSHPHGCPKHVSIGQWIIREEVQDIRTRYTYAICTCPGSSGAHVHSLGYGGWLFDHAHSGVNAQGTNFSGAGRELL